MHLNPTEMAKMEFLQKMAEFLGILDLEISTDSVYSSFEPE